MFGDDEFCLAAYVVAVFVKTAVGVVLGAMYETYYVRVLFYRTRFAEVRKLGAFVFVAAVFELSVQLRQRYDWNVQLLGELFEASRYCTYFLLARTQLYAGCHQLQIVDDDDLHLMLAHKTPRFGAQFHYRKSRRIVHIHGQTLKSAHARGQLAPVGCREVTALDFFARQLAGGGYKTVDKLKIAHLKREHGNWVVMKRYIESHRQHERRLTHSRARRDDNEVGVLPARSDLVELPEAGAETTQT